MKLASIREFRMNLSAHTKRGAMVIVTNHGRVVGCYLPLANTAEIPMEFKREFVSKLGGVIASELAASKIHDKEILDDFKASKKTRRRP